MPKYCSPTQKKNKDKYLKNISCFDKESLLTIATSYNNVYSSDKINIPKTFTQASLATFWNTLRKQISKQTNCSEENCWIETTIGKKALEKDQDIGNFLRPLQPKEWKHNPNEWLSTLDIEKVLDQYNVYNDFIFIGAVPIDFDTKLSPGMCVINELCNINIQKLYKKGIRKIGVVFNLDKHTEKGSHWISLFISIYKGSIFYFDSYGYPPNKEISTLIHTVRKMMNTLFTSTSSIIKYIDIESEISNKITKIGTNTYAIKNNLQKDTPVFYKTNKTYKPITILNSSKHLDMYKIQTNKALPTNAVIVQRGTFVFFNSKRYQYKSSACGMYSIIFIIELLKNKSIYQVLREMKQDDETEALRKKYFRPNTLNVK